MRLDNLLDILLGCKLTEQIGYFIEDRTIWRDTLHYCGRCGRIGLHTQRRVDEKEFWTDDEAFSLPIQPSLPSNELKLDNFKSTVKFDE